MDLSASFYTVWVLVPCCLGSLLWPCSNVTVVVRRNYMYSRCDLTSGREREGKKNSLTWCLHSVEMPHLVMFNLLLTKSPKVDMLLYLLGVVLLFVVLFCFVFLLVKLLWRQSSPNLCCWGNAVLGAVLCTCNKIPHFMMLIVFYYTETEFLNMGREHFLMWGDCENANNVCSSK